MNNDNYRLCRLVASRSFTMRLMVNNSLHIQLDWASCLELRSRLLGIWKGMWQYKTQKRTHTSLQAFTACMSYWSAFIYSVLGELRLGWADIGVSWDWGELTLGWADIGVSWHWGGVSWHWGELTLGWADIGVKPPSVLPPVTYPRTLYWGGTSLAVASIFAITMSSSPDNCKCQTASVKEIHRSCVLPYAVLTNLCYRNKQISRLSEHSQTKQLKNLQGKNKREMNSKIKSNN